MTRASDMQTDNVRLGRRLIDAALKIEDSLAELLAVQVTHMKHLNEKDLNEEIINTNALLKNIIYSLMLTDERIVRGLELCGISAQNVSKPSWLATEETD